MSLPINWEVWQIDRWAIFAVVLWHHLWGWTEMQYCHWDMTWMDLGSGCDNVLYDSFLHWNLDNKYAVLVICYLWGYCIFVCTLDCIAVLFQVCRVVAPNVQEVDGFRRNSRLKLWLRLKQSLECEALKDVRWSCIELYLVSPKCCELR